MFPKLLSSQDLLSDSLYFSIAPIFSPWLNCFSETIFKELLLKEPFTFHSFELEFFQIYLGQARTLARTNFWGIVRAVGER